MSHRSRAKLTRQGLFLLVLVLGAVLATWLRPVAPVHAQARLVSLVSQDNGHVALGLALRRLGVVGVLMQTVPHPDDEHNHLYALLALGQGLRKPCIVWILDEGSIHRGRSRSMGRGKPLAPPRWPGRAFERGPSWWASRRGGIKSPLSRRSRAGRDLGGTLPFGPG